MSVAGYRPVLAEGAADFLLQPSKRRQKKVLAFIRQLAAHPHIRSDYSLPDESGREIEHLMIDAYVFAYWLDHSSREIRITDLDDASSNGAYKAQGHTPGSAHAARSAPVPSQLIFDIGIPYALEPASWGQAAPPRTELLSFRKHFRQREDLPSGFDSNMEHEIAVPEDRSENQHGPEDDECGVHGGVKRWS